MSTCSSSPVTKDVRQFELVTAPPLLLSPRDLTLACDTVSDPVGWLGRSRPSVAVRR